MREPTPIHPDEIAAIVLCGGRSRRFGSDKALARLGGETLLGRMIECAGARADRIVLACGPEARYAEYGLDLALDAPGIEGPMAGVLAGLEAAGRPYVFLLAVDLAALTPGALDALLAAFAASPPVDLVVPSTARGLEPLAAFGRTEALRTAARAIAASDDPAPRRLVEHVAARLIPVGDDPADPLARALRNANAPADLESLSG